MTRPEESLDVQPTDIGWRVVVPLPGIAARDLTVNVTETELSIETLVTGSSQADGFSYRLALPADVATEQVHTELVDGTLIVTMPRREPLPPSAPAPPETLSVPSDALPPSPPNPSGAVR